MPPYVDPVVLAEKKEELFQRRKLKRARVRDDAKDLPYLKSQRDMEVKTTRYGVTARTFLGPDVPRETIEELDDASDLEKINSGQIPLDEEDDSVPGHPTTRQAIKYQDVKDEDKEVKVKVEVKQEPKSEDESQASSSKNQFDPNIVATLVLGRLLCVFEPEAEIDEVISQ